MHTHNMIDYIEFGVTDIADAKRFYNEVFGWKFTDYSPTYVGIQSVSGEVGGLTEVAKIRRGGPLVVMYSKNLEESLEVIKSAGGDIMKDIFSFPGGRRFHFLDPSGNELAVWSDASER